MMDSPSQPNESQRPRPQLHDHNDVHRQCRQKLIDWKFDPGNLSQETAQWYSSALRPGSNIPYGMRKTRALVLFAQLGDLTMLRYILQSSPNPHFLLHQTDEYGLFPLYTAISEPHSEDDILQMCQWLHQQGANLQQSVGGEWTPLSRACLKGYVKVALWLIQSGALLQRQLDQETPVFATALARRDLPRPDCLCGLMCRECLYQARETHQALFLWARETIAINRSFWCVMLGTLDSTNGMLDRNGDDEERLRRVLSNRIAKSFSGAQNALAFLLRDVCMKDLWKVYEMTLSPLSLLNGHTGVLERIGMYVGVTTRRDHLVTARGLIEYEKTWATCSFSSDMHCVDK